MVAAPVLPRGQPSKGQFVHLRRLMILVVSCVVLAIGAGLPSASAQSGDPKVLERLNDEQRGVYADWRAARAGFERVHDAYWAAISARRAERRRKIGAGAQVTPADFVMQLPPKYAGPSLRADIAKIQADVAKLQAETSPAPESEITTLAEMMAAASQLYRFAPSIVPEREFKRRYAVEALAVGLTKDEVTRIFAFETGGRGTFDMQSGVNPDTKAGKPISTAMGYAQLLAANSIDELVRSGDGFITRLQMMAARPGTPPQRVQELTAKIEALRQMIRTARSVPKEWSRHVELARTPRGFGIHVINLDGDIGPWLQVIKLKGIKNTAEGHGISTPTPAELEIMNLSGPRTGLEMMEPVGKVAPTANFFSQAAYYRNTIVREKTGGELLAAIDGRMSENMLKAGSIEFAAVFDEVMGTTRQVRFDDRQQLMAPPMRVAPAVNGPVAAVRPVAPPPQVPYAGPVPATGMRRDAYAPEGLIPPAPIPAVQPAAPLPRAQWAPPGFRAREGTSEILRPQGFPD
jgi:hypothetical protein